MSDSFLSRRTKFGVSGALLILLIFFFLMPSAFRGARLAIAGKKNNIKDWLPGDFRETVELEWFAKYFIGESFVVATWDGCTADDQRLSLLANKLRNESAERDLTNLPPDVARARELAEELQLFVEAPESENWGGLDEKWFSSPSGQYFYITPDGRFYRWNDDSNAVGGVVRAVRRRMGTYELSGQFVAAFGTSTNSTGANPYHNDPTLLAASLFQSVQTGTDTAKELAREGGPLWPIDLTDASKRAEVAYSLAVDRLTGTLFAPAVPDDFDWTPSSVRDRLPKQTIAQLPKDFDERVRSTVALIEERLSSSGLTIHQVSMEDRSKLWAEVCDALEVPVPARQTCVLVTLTPLGKEYLARSIGRGVIGGPRGRLLMLADESGIAAAPRPSMAPPPFDHPENQLADASGRAMLRMGGPPVDNVAIDEEGTVTLVRLVGYSGLVGMGLAFLCFRSVKLTIMIFLVGLSSAVLGLAITYWSGGNVDAILMTMPSMVYISGLSGAIHIISYCRDEARDNGPDGAIIRATKHAFMPAFLCSFTTALGLWSLCSSNIVPISNFGLYTGIAVMTMLVILFTYLPAALEVFPPSFLQSTGKAKGNSGASAKRHNDPSRNVETNWVADVWEAVGRWITRHHVFVSLSCLLLFIVSAWGLFRIETTVQLLKLFDAKSRIISDYAYLEKNFGKLVPMELVVRIPPSMQAEKRDDLDNLQNLSKDEPSAAPEFSAASHPLTVLERIEAVGRIETVARRALGEAGSGVIGKSMSAVTFLPPLPDPSAGYSPIRSRFQNELKASLTRLEQTDCFRVENGGPRDGSELWRISLRVGALSNVDYGQFVGDLRLTVTPVLDAYRTRGMILDQLQNRGDDATSRELPRILFLGHREPKRLSEESFVNLATTDVDSTESLIRAGTIYSATIGELMMAERVKPAWIDVEAVDAKIRPGEAKWNQLISSVDCVVLVDDQANVDLSELKRSAKCFVDARRSNLPQAEPTLDGIVPVETNPGPLEVVYTGIVPVVYKAQRTLLVSLIESTAMASVSIAAVMTVLMIPGRLPWAFFQPKPMYFGIMAGLVAMVPNMFPIIMVFGMMGHANILVDIGTMMTASVALGIAVDDTIHFLSWFRQHLDSGMSRVEAVIQTYRRVGPAMMQTAFVGGLGMFVFALSTFTPTQRFGTLMLVMLFTALLGDLILLPALLAGPLGRWFRPRTPVPKSDDGANVVGSTPIEIASVPTNRMGDSQETYMATHGKQDAAPAPKAMDKPLAKQSSLARLKPRRDSK